MGKCFDSAVHRAMLQGAQMRSHFFYRLMMGTVDGDSCCTVNPVQKTLFLNNRIMNIITDSAFGLQPAMDVRPFYILCQAAAKTLIIFFFKYVLLI